MTCYPAFWGLYLNHDKDPYETTSALRQTNTANWKWTRIEDVFRMKMVIFQPAMVVYPRVINHYSNHYIGSLLNNQDFTRKVRPGVFLTWHPGTNSILGHRDTFPTLTQFSTVQLFTKLVFLNFFGGYLFILFAAVNSDDALQSFFRRFGCQTDDSNSSKYVILPPLLRWRTKDYRVQYINVSCFLDVFPEKACPTPAPSLQAF